MLGRGHEATDRLDGDPDAQGDQQHGVDERAEDLRALIAVGVAFIRRARGDEARDERDHERRGIREHVRGIREERQRSGQDGADDLDDHDQ